MYVCTLEEFILVEIWIAFQVGTELWNGNYTGIYTITTKDGKCENCSFTQEIIT